MVRLLLFALALSIAIAAAALYAPPVPYPDMTSVDSLEGATNE